MTEYQKYQLQWMIDHNHSLEELFERMDEIVDEKYHSSDRPLPTDVMEDFEEIGFKGSEIWTCEDEWEMNDKNMDEDEETSKEMHKDIINELIEKQIAKNLNSKYRNKQNDFDEIVNQCLSNRTLQTNDSEPSSTKNKKYETIYEFILDKLGVSEGEKFNIILNSGKPSAYNPYYFNDGYLFDCLVDLNDGLFAELITGKVTIEKLPWKPKDGDSIWYVNNRGMIFKTIFTNHVYDLAMFQCGWLFQTKEEAEKNRERILKEMKEIFENDE